MEKQPNFNVQHEVFSSERIEDMVILRLKENLLRHATDLSLRDTILKFIDTVSTDDSVKVLLIMGAPSKSGREEYIEFYYEVLRSKLDRNAVHRMYNIVDQFILRLVDLNKIVLHADSGRIISLFLNVSLACDLRIIADNTVFQNSYLELGLVPKGGGAFFLSKMLGTRKAMEIMLLDEDIDALKAFELGIVDKVVPLDDLEKTALDTAQRFSRLPASSLSGVKKLLKFTLKDLANYLEFENEELLKIVRYSDVSGS